MLTKEFVENLEWNDVIDGYGSFEPDEDNFIMKNFSSTLWYYNSGEFDMSEYIFAQEKELALDRF